MSKYHTDRAFSNYIHQHLAMDLIYRPLGWVQVELRADYAQYIDMMDGIDYVFRKKDEIKSVQERFRDKSYSNFSDFTIRYRRDENTNTERKESEYYKMKAHYFTYGIIDSSKENFKCSKAFLKFAIIDLKKVYDKIDSGHIFISDNRKNRCRIVDADRIECPVKYNLDGSSSFFPIDISYLVKLWGDTMLVSQKGFL